MKNKKKSAQSTIEYLLLVTAVVGFLNVFFQGDDFKGQFERTYTPGTEDVQKMSTHLWNAIGKKDLDPTSPPPRQAIVWQPEPGDPQPCDSNPNDPSCWPFNLPEYDPGSPLPQDPEYDPRADMPFYQPPEYDPASPLPQNPEPGDP
ncbi:MAG: hypothetical protein NUV91_05560, partial [Candidatus Omnitrophica bacterium]|nr:hypothetical protein [Candidatus Omnitrophota bacterium]